MIVLLLSQSHVLHGFPLGWGQAAGCTMPFSECPCVPPTDRGFRPCPISPSLESVSVSPSGTEHRVTSPAGVSTRPARWTWTQGIESRTEAKREACGNTTAGKFTPHLHGYLVPASSACTRLVAAIRNAPESFHQLSITGQCSLEDVRDHFSQPLAPCSAAKSATAVNTLIKKATTVYVTATVAEMSKPL